MLTEALVDVTLEAQVAMSFPLSETEGKTQFTRKEIQKLRSGRPLTGPGSRGGRGTRGRTSVSGQTRKRRDTVMNRMEPAYGRGEGTEGASTNGEEEEEDELVVADKEERVGVEAEEGDEDEDMGGGDEG